MLYDILLDITKYGHENRPFWETLQKNQFKCKIFAWLLSFQKLFIGFYQFESSVYLHLK